MTLASSALGMAVTQPPAYLASQSVASQSLNGSSWIKDVVAERELSELVRGDNPPPPAAAAVAAADDRS